MNKLLLLTLLPTILFSAIPKPDSFGLSEEDQVELLMKSAQTTLEKLTLLKEALVAFRSQEAKCIQDPSNRDQLLLLSQKALELKFALKQAGVDEYFRQEFLQEVSHLSKIAEKPSIPQVNREMIR